MEYHIAIKFQESDELLIRFNDSDLVQDYLYLFYKNYQRQLPLFRDQGAYSLERMRELVEQCGTMLNWHWDLDRYDGFENTTLLHKDLEKYLARGFNGVPKEHDSLLHELHICLHSSQLKNQRTTMQLEWFNDDGFSLADYNFKFVHDNTLGAVFLQNPYVGHPPDWIWEQNDFTNVWQTCKFHDFVRPGLVINMLGSLERSVISFPQEEYLRWWETFAPDFLQYHGVEKMLANTGKPVIGYIINNQLLLGLQTKEKINFEYVRFHPDLKISPSRQKFLPEFQINKQDYERIAGPSWPDYDDFFLHNNRPAFVIEEIYQMTGIKINS
jgi:hypothetical protein